MGSFFLSIRRPFVADHYHDLPGFVEERHGHNWEAEATFRGEDGEPGARVLDAWVEGMDYSLLNAQTTLAGGNPTAELLAQDLFRFLEDRRTGVIRVKVREKANYWASCSREAR